MKFAHVVGARDYLALFRNKENENNTTTMRYPTGYGSERELGFMRNDTTKQRQYITFSNYGDKNNTLKCRTKECGSAVKQKATRRIRNRYCRSL